MELVVKAKNIRVEYHGRDVLDIDGLELYDYDRIGKVTRTGGLAASRPEKDTRQHEITMRFMRWRKWIP